MAHMYNVQDLLADCTEYLKTVITEANVLDIWREASKHDNAILCNAVVWHLKKTSQQAFLEFLRAIEAKNT